MKTFPTLLFLAVSTFAAHAAPQHAAIVKTNWTTLDRSRNLTSVPLQLAQPSAEFHAQVKDGAKWKTTTNSLARQPGSANLQIELNKVYFLTQPAPSGISPQGGPHTNKYLASSLLVMGRRGTGAASNRAEIISGNLFIRADQEPVLWQSRDKAYKTGLTIGFDSPNSAAELQSFFPLAVYLQGSNVTISPTRVSITAANVGGYQPAVVSSARYTANAAVIAHYDEQSSGAADQVCPLQIEQLGFGGMIGLLFPATFLFATVAGGCAGGALRLFKLRRRKRAQWYWLFPESILVGLVFVAALSAGLGGASGNLSSVVVGNEIGAFAIAALSGFVGTAALDYFTNNLFKPASSG